MAISLDPSRSTGPSAGLTTVDYCVVANSHDGPELIDRGPVATVRYVLGQEIARGGMGVIYKATDLAFGREVAVKVVKDRFARDAGSGRRFADEARITGRFQHPGIPPAHDAGTLPDGRAFLAMKLVSGETLDELLSRRPNPAVDRGRFVAIFEQVCQATAYAHAQGVVHRDLKPANVMVGAFGEVQVMDWGLAKVLADRQETESDEAALKELTSLDDSGGPGTEAGEVLGTPAFMPPEQAAGGADQADARSDVFGLGAILAVILTGQPPFAAASTEATRRKAAQGDLRECFERLSESGADPELVALCKLCLSSNPAGRPADASAVASVVASLRQAADERIRRAELAAAEARTRRKVHLTLLAMVGAVLVGAVFIVRWQERRTAEVEGRVTQALVTADHWATRAEGMETETVAGADTAVGLWRQAVIAAENAEWMATTAGSTNLVARTSVHAERARGGLQSAEVTAKRGRRDAELLASIETAQELIASGPLDGRHGVAVAHAIYTRALEAAGIDTSTTGALVEALRAERPSVRAILIPALDRWMETSTDKAERDRLRAALDLADDDALRRQVRAAVDSQDRAFLLHLAKRPDVVSLPAVTVDQLGRGLFAVQEYATAERLFRLARDQFPSDFWLTADLGTTLLLRQLISGTSPSEPARVEEIVGCFRSAVALRPKSVVGYAGLAFSLHILKGDLLSAEAAYRKLTEIAPTISSGHLGLAGVLQKKGDLDGAEAAYRTAIQVAPMRSRFLAWVALGQILERKSDMVGAATAYVEAIHLDPMNSVPRIALARVIWTRLCPLFPRLSSIFFR